MLLGMDAIMKKWANKTERFLILIYFHIMIYLYVDLLMNVMYKQILSENEVGETSGGVNAAASSVELRMVPSGPDPLHHNGNTKKPRSP